VSSLQQELNFEVSFRPGFLNRRSWTVNGPRQTVTSPKNILLSEVFSFLKLLGNVISKIGKIMNYKEQ
jgi:hypothetical protein